MSQRIETLMREGFAARREGRLEDAEAEFVKAVTLCRKGGSKIDLIQALKGRGQIARDLGNHREALTFYGEAAGLCRQLGDALRLAHTLRHLGDIHVDLGDLGKGEPLYQEALAVYGAHPESGVLDVANCLRPMAILQERLGNREAAVRFWKQARDRYRRLGILEGVAECDNRLTELG